MSDKIKPCPFCGSEADFFSYEIKNKIFAFSIVCSTIGCVCGDEDFPASVFSCEEAAAEAWNTRDGTKEDNSE